MLNKLVIQNQKDLNLIKDKWLELEDGSDMTFYQSFEWNKLLYKQWNRSLYNKLTSEVVILHDENVIMPFIRQKIGLSIKWLGRKKGLHLLGEDSYSDYLNLIYKENSFNWGGTAMS